MAKKVEERFMCLHPEGKNGVNIVKHKYEQVKEVLLELVPLGHTKTYKDLMQEGSLRLNPAFDGKSAWYIVSVKLDLEARGFFERIKGKSGHSLKRIKQ